MKRREGGKKRKNPCSRGRSSSIYNVLPGLDQPAGKRTGRHRQKIRKKSIVDVIEKNTPGQSTVKKEGPCSYPKYYSACHRRRIDRKGVPEKRLNS